jgi:hypothetical protein
MTATGENAHFIAQKLENCRKIAVYMSFLILHDGST